MRSIFLLLALISLLIGCASTPDFDTTQVDASLTPQSVVAEPGPSHGKVVLWGGIILDTRNLNDTTQIEVLAYPLNDSDRPMQAEKPLGRFIIVQQGFLEPTTYAQGLPLTVLGSVGDNQDGKVGDSSYTYPVINSQKLHLWSPKSDKTETIFHFGIGIEL